MNRKYAIIAVALAITVIGLLYWQSRQQQSKNSNTAKLDNSSLDRIKSSETTDSSNQSPVNSGENAPPGSIHNLPVPKAVAAVRIYVAQKLKIGEGQVVILLEEEQEWPDSCLGLASPDEMCAQVITPGHRVTVTASGQEFVYRTNEDGTVIRAE